MQKIAAISRIKAMCKSFCSLIDFGLIITNTFKALV